MQRRSATWIVRPAAALLAALALALPARGAPPPAGETIRNTASATYAAVFGPVVSSSNSVSFPVRPRLAPTSGPDLVVSLAHRGNVSVGHAVAYDIGVRNIGALPTSGPVSVTGTLPAGLEFLAAGSGGAGWSCVADAQVVTCTSSATVPASVNGTPGVHPNVLRVRAMARASAFPSVPATVTKGVVVAGGGEPAANAGNNEATDATLVQAAASISGLVWRDTNHNRVYDDGAAAAAAGWIVELCAPQTAQCDATDRLAAATTANDGTYRIDGLEPGAYRVQFRDPSSRAVHGRPVNGDGVNPPQPASQPDTSTGQFLDITLAPGEHKLSQSLPVDPTGVVYDSVTRRAVAGAVVMLQGPPGFDPTVHLVGGAGNVAQTVGAEGAYQFLLTAAGVALFADQPFTLAVTAPAGYQPGPSQLLPAAATYPAGSCTGTANCIDPTGLAAQAYSVQPGGLATPPPHGADTRHFLRFALAPGDPDIVNNHLPVDPVGAHLGNLLVQKVASQPTVAIGEFVDYTVTVKNTTADAVRAVALDDILPTGFTYVKGSARIDGKLAVDPSGSAGPRLGFPLGTLAGDTSATVTYRVLVSGSATLGNGVNAATARARGYGSNTAQVRVRVIGGVFDTRGFILGVVFLDCNGNGEKDDDEAGIPGVRVFLEDGSLALTDGEGKYSLYGVTPRTHVLKVDPFTLPPGAALAVIDNRQALSPGSRFIDMKNGELQRGDFAAGTCSPDVLAAVQARRAAAAVIAPESDRLLKNRLPTESTPRVPADVRGLPTAGTVGAQEAGGSSPVDTYRPLFSSPTPGGGSLAPGPAAVTPSPLVTALPGVAPPPKSDTLETKLLNASENTLGFVNLRDRDILAASQTNVLVKGPLGASFALTVNGVAVSHARVGKKGVLEAKQVTGWEYVGVDLKPGPNTLAAQIIDPFGNARGTETITVFAPDQLARLRLSAPETADADGVSRIPLGIALSDAEGLPVTSRTPITLETTSGRFAVEDLNPNEPGVQVFLEGGRGEFELVAPATPGEAVVRASSGPIAGEARIAFLPELRPLVGAGVIEGAINLRNLDLRNVIPARQHDGFEQELQQVVAGSAAGKSSASGRAALFLKGKIRGDYLLTLAYDSDKAVREQLFRDIQPDAFYPIYGDASIKGFDAQSTSRLYVRIDKVRSYVLYGDFTTQSAPGVRVLSQYPRALNGAKAHYEDSRVSANVFGSNDTFGRIVEEFAANGTSGPFQLNTRGSFIATERVEVLTRDRNQPSIVLKVDLKARFTDYEIEPLTGRLLFKAPVPSLDLDLNPITIRVTYEVDQGGAPFWVYGADGQMRITDWFEVGANYVNDQNPGKAFEMRGANATVRMGPRTFLVGEAAQTEREDAGQGKAARLELRHEDERWMARAYGGRADPTFDNPSSLLNRGRAEYGGRVTYKLDAQTLLTGETIVSEDLRTGGRRRGAYLKVDRVLNSWLRGELGLRYAQETAAPASTVSPQLTNPVTGAPVDFTSVRARLTARVPYVPHASVFTEYEQAVNDSAKRSFGVGGEYRFLERSRVYARHQFLSSLSTSDYSLNTVQRNNTTLVGIDTPYMSGGQMFSEYRVHEVLDGRAAQAAVGLRNTWEIAPGLRFSTTSERVQALRAADPIAGPATERNFRAMTGALEYTGSDRWKGSVRLEHRTGTSQEGWLGTAAAALKLNEDFSLLARTVYAYTGNKTAPGERIVARTLAGLAYRDSATNRVSALARVEQRYEHDTTNASAPIERDVSVFSSHANWQPQRGTILTGRYAAKWAVEDSLGVASSAFTHLVQARMTRDITAKWDAGVQASLIGDGTFSSRRYGLGAEVGYLLGENMWLSVGYNIFGFKDRDLGTDAGTDRGVFVRLRYKFDEDLFRFLRASGGSEKFRTQTPTGAGG